jgi:hypothetical protein
MADETRPEGRPAITEEDKQEMLQKLEPYLKSGLSIRKALKEAEIPSSTFFDIMSKDLKFAEQINRFRQFVSVLLNNAIVRKLQDIIKKQNAGTELTKDDTDFLKWFATNSNLTREEFGERKDIGLYDPEIEIQKIAGLIDELSTKEVKTDEQPK